MYRKHASSRAPQQVALGDDSLIHANIHLFFSNVLLVKRRSLYLFFFYSMFNHIYSICLLFPLSSLFAVIHRNIYSLEKVSYQCSSLKLPFIASYAG